MSEVEGCNLACIIKDFDPDRFKVITESTTTKRKVSEDDSDDDGQESEDSMFDEAPANTSAIVEDTKNGRHLKAGSRIKIKISDVQVSEGTLIL